MKKPKLPLPFWILILATLFLLGSAFGERIGHPAAAARNHPSETVEQQKAAIVYVRVMSWLSRVITHPAARTEDDVKNARPVEPISAQVFSATGRGVQLCALHKSSRPSKSRRRLSCRTLLRTQRWQGPKELHSAAGLLGDSSTTANGS